MSRIAIVSAAAMLAAAMLGTVPAHAASSTEGTQWPTSKRVNYPLPPNMTAAEKKSTVAYQVMDARVDRQRGTQRNPGTGAPEYCGTAYVTVKAYNQVNQKLWDWATSQYWCWNYQGNAVTRYNPMVINGTTTTLGKSIGWGYDGVVSGPTTGKLSNWEYRTNAQGSYTWAPFFVGGEIYTSNPYVQMDLKGDGTYYATWDDDPGFS